jgi:hypothetical protein
MIRIARIAEASDEFASELYSLIAVARFDDTERIRVSDIASSMALEHWDAARLLLAQGSLLSAVVVHRAQFEALVRSIWILYAASDIQIAKLADNLTLESEQAAKNLPQVSDMMNRLATKAPPEAYDALSRIKDNTWKALNSYVHAGIHPLRRHEEGYPIDLLVDMFRNANGMAVVTAMQIAVLSGLQPLQKHILALASRRPECMPSRL